MRDEDAAIADRTNQGAEGLLVALSRLIHDCRSNRFPSGFATDPGGVTEHECSAKWIVPD